MPTNLEAIHAAQHSGVGRDGMTEQRIPPALGVEAKRGGLGFQTDHRTGRHPHLMEQTRPQGTGRTGHGHMGQHIGTKRQPQRGVLGGVLKGPPRFLQGSQSRFRSTEHGAQGVDVQHAAVLPLGGIHAPHMKGGHGHVPSFSVQRKGPSIEVVGPPHVPRAGTAHHLSIGPSHHSTQGAHRIKSVHMKRHHLRMHVGQPRLKGRFVHSFRCGSNPLHPMHEPLHHGISVDKTLLEFPSTLRARPHRHLQGRQRMRHHLGDSQAIPSQRPMGILLATGSRPPLVQRPRRKLLCVHVPEIKVIRFAA